MPLHLLNWTGADEREMLYGMTDLPYHIPTNPNLAENNVKRQEIMGHVSDQSLFHPHSRLYTEKC